MILKNMLFTRELPKTCLIALVIYKCLVLHKNSYKLRRSSLIYIKVKQVPRPMNKIVIWDIMNQRTIQKSPPCIHQEIPKIINYLIWMQRFIMVPVNKKVLTKFQTFPYIQIKQNNTWFKAECRTHQGKKLRNLNLAKILVTIGQPKAIYRIKVKTVLHRSMQLIPQITVFAIKH